MFNIFFFHFKKRDQQARTNWRKKNNSHQLIHRFFFLHLLNVRQISETEIIHIKPDYANERIVEKTSEFFWENFLMMQLSE